jgi:hypothetical protein
MTRDKQGTEPPVAPAERAPGIAHSPSDPAESAREGRTDAVSAGLVKGFDPTGGEARGDRADSAAARSGKTAGNRNAEREAPARASGGETDRRSRAFGAALASKAADDLDEDGDLDDARAAEGRARGVVSAGRTIRSRIARRPDPDTTNPERSEAKRRGRRPEGGARERIRKRRAWSAARAASTEGPTRAAAQGAAARASTSRGLAAAASSAAAPVAGVVSAVVFFVLAALLVSQLVSSLFGFWDNEAASRSVEALPPYITSDMVEAALECQEQYGHPAGCTLAQIIVESGQGDHLSGLAERDNNLFGIKWASSFAGCPEVAGKESWSTNEEYGGQTVSVMAAFTRFKSHRDCIAFRSRVLLQNARYAGNPLIRQAIAEHDSDKMAEELKDAGYATSSSYVESLIPSWTLRPQLFDGMTAKDWREAGPPATDRRRGGEPARGALRLGRVDAGKGARLLGARPVLLPAGRDIAAALLGGPGGGRQEGAALGGEARRHPVAPGPRGHLRRRRRVHPRAPHGRRVPPRDGNLALHVRNPLLGKEKAWRGRTSSC